MDKLTARQVQVLGLVANGLTHLEASAALGLRPDAAPRHLERARRRLGAKTTAQALAIALSACIIPPVRATTEE